MKLYRYWAKSIRDGSDFHLLPYHLLDVAACGLELLDRLPQLEARIDNALACKGFARGVLVPLLALHDAGKVSSGFQNLAPELFAQLQPNRSTSLGYDRRHDLLGFFIWDESLWRKFMSRTGLLEAGWDQLDMLPLVNAIMGHHGKPLDRGEFAGCSVFIDDEDFEAIEDFFAELDALGIIQTVAAPDPYDAEPNPISWLIAGWASLSDWLGSNEKVFRKTSEKIPLGDYWELARERASQSIPQSGVIAPPASEVSGFSWLFEDWVPTAIQSWADKAELGDEPHLVIIEDATGSGKTEAALTWAQRKLQHEEATGLYIGLPTMATANGMFPRLQDQYRKFFAAGSTPSLVLSHGGRGLDDRFTSTILSDFDSIEVEELDREDAPSESVCAAWVANSTKLSLLAPVGVGTIDQAMLAVLAAKYQSMRMIGLFQKILVVDEIHAYDAYMGKIIEALLTYMASVGRSAVLLSATLPRAKRQELVDAYRRGLGVQSQPLTCDAYPLVTDVTAADTREYGDFDTDETRVRTLPIKATPRLDVVLDEIEKAANDGACVAWVRNTVDDAVDAYEDLRARLGDDNVILFHARFCVADRQELERRVLALFGKVDRPEDARGKVVVATQVIEQSLDLDFDMMVTDLAPIDLVLQRIGRMRRHKRDADGVLLDRAAKDGRVAPAVIIHGPAYVEEPDPDWYGRHFEKAQYVYPDTPVLWRTARELECRESIVIPTENRELVERGYDESDVPDGLVEVLEELRGELQGDKSVARLGLLNLDRGYTAMSNYAIWLHDTQARTRLGEPTTTFRLGIDDGNQIRPWADGRHAWAMSEVRIASRKACCAKAFDDQEQRIRISKEAMRDHGKFAELLPLTRRDDSWVATVVDQNGSDRIATYSEQYGLRLATEGA